MSRKAMHQTTVRFGADLWSALESEAARLGISAAQYVRDAALVRLAYTEGLQHGRDRSPWAEFARQELENQVAETIDSAVAVRSQGTLARQRAARARADARRLREERRELAK